MSLSALSVGPIRTLADVGKAFSDVESFTRDLMSILQPLVNRPGAGDLVFAVQEDDGQVHQWTLIAGAGITLTFDATLRTCTITSP